jgi:hypothetical protein
MLISLPVSSRLMITIYYPHLLHNLPFNPHLYRISLNITAFTSYSTTKQRENVYRTFKFTPRTAQLITFWGAVIPAGMALAAWASDVSVIAVLDGRCDGRIELHRMKGRRNFGSI